MDLASRKIAVIENILGLSDERVLSALEHLLNSKVLYQNGELTKEEFIENIEESIADYKMGKHKNANDVIKDFEA